MQHAKKIFGVGGLEFNLAWHLILVNQWGPDNQAHCRRVPPACPTFPSSRLDRNLETDDLGTCVSFALHFAWRMGKDDCSEYRGGGYLAIRIAVGLVAGESVVVWSDRRVP